MKRVVFSGPRQAGIEEAPRPIRNPGEALLRVHYVGICGTDIHSYQGTNPMITYPVVPGHELSCTVVESEGKFSPGDHVVVEPFLACGRCYPCSLGRYNCCEQLKVIGVHTPGGMVEEMTVPERLLHRLPPGADPSLAPLVEMLSIGYHACNRGRVRAEDRVLVIGAGPIGLGAALTAKERGARVGLVDRFESRLRLSQELGVDFTLQAGGELESSVLKRFGSRPSVVIEAVGNPKTLEQALDIVSAAGRVVYVGWTSESPTWSPDFFLRKELELLGSRNSCGVFPAVVDYYSRNTEKLKRIVTHRFKMKDIGKAMNFIHDHGAETMKVIMEW